MKEFDSKIVSFLISEINVSWKKIFATYNFSDSGGLGMKLEYEDEHGEIKKKVISPRKWNTNAQELKQNYSDTKDFVDERFNTVRFNISEDGSFHSEYHWSDENHKKNQSDKERLFPQWINERIMSLIYDFEFPNGPTEKDDDGEPVYVSTWDEGTFAFTINRGEMESSIVLLNEGESRDVKLQLPDYFIKAMLEHHDITNNGILKDEWKPWNKLVIKSPHNDLPYGEFDEYVFYSQV